MTLARTKIPTACVSVSARIEVLEDILGQGVELAIWQRERPADLAWLDHHDWDQIDDIDAIVLLDDLHGEVIDLMRESFYPTGEQGSALASEIISLAAYFADLMGSTSLRLRLEVVETDACRKFHTDHVAARLLSTFSGQGTQWIYASAQADIQQMAPGDVGIFKGRLWEENPTVLHRSPPIAAAGETRLLLALDPAP
ncbi:DUF1826 domain-containing protein [Novosphingobium terrae]|uniref:DUF1826 domain-containing protein n=1 Tax=Novosphingobium terrae TaxID=2726189 RepID=UPI00197CC677|nr:DUF1826 domain-containing protein [Novosphingobium terrae]